MCCTPGRCIISCQMYTISLVPSDGTSGVEGGRCPGCRGLSLIIKQQTASLKTARSITVHSLARRFQPFLLSPNHHGTSMGRPAPIRHPRSARLCVPHSHWWDHHRHCPHGWVYSNNQTFVYPTYDLVRYIACYFGGCVCFAGHTGKGAAVLVAPLWFAHEHWLHDL